MDFVLSKRKIEYFEFGTFELSDFQVLCTFCTRTDWHMFNGCFLVPVKGGIGGIFDPPIGRKYTTYIPLIDCRTGGVICYWSHLLREPETTVDMLVVWLLVSILLPLQLIGEFCIWKKNLLFQGNPGGWNMIIHYQVIQVVTFLSPSWRSLNHLKGSLNHPKKATKNCQVIDLYIHPFIHLSSSHDASKLVKFKFSQLKMDGWKVPILSFWVSTSFQP